MIKVKVKENSEDSFKKAISKFNKLCKRDGFIYEIKLRRYFRKPSEIKRQERNQSIRRSRNNG